MGGFLDGLASGVARQLIGVVGVPSESTLQSLFETMYFASLTSEEGQGIAFHIVYIDPDNPDPSPPTRIRDDRWGFVRLGERLAFDIPTLNKLAKASDPRSSSLAVFHNDRGRIFIWGLIDQGNQYLDFVTYNKESGPERPGVFQAGTIEPGHLQVFCGYELLADFRINEIRRKALDPLDRGPVRKSLDPGLQKYLSFVSAEVQSTSNQPESGTTALRTTGCKPFDACSSGFSSIGTVGPSS